MQTKALKESDLSIGDVSTRTGLAPSAIRFYEDEGLITPWRNAGGQRRFERADIRRLSFIRISQSLGVPLSEIRNALQSLPKGRTPTKADWSRLSKRFRGELNTRIAQMEALRDTLDGCIGCGCLSLKKCALFNPEDKARGLGNGPRYLLGDKSSDVV